MLMDSHCHLQAREFDADRETALERAAQAGVGAMVVVGWDLASSVAALELASRHSALMATVGCHPHYASGLDQAGLADLRQLARHPLAAAIGEIGLDFYRNLSPREAQAAAFQAQLELAAEEGLPVVVHSRNADEETFATLEPWAREVGRHWPPARPLGVMHCYAGDLALARRYIELGFLISIAGPVTYPKAERLVEVAREIPSAAMAVETDAPYLPPQPHRGHRNEPAYLRETVARLAELRGETFAAIAEATAANAHRLFSRNETATASIVPTGSEA